MVVGGGIGKVAVLVSAETKQAMKQLRDVNKKYKDTAKTSQGFSKALGRGVKRFGIIAMAALTAVTGGFYIMLRASSYAAVYTKRWQAEQTLIANEWVRRHGGVFDKITELYVGFRKQYVGTGKTLLIAFEDAFGIKFPSSSPVKTAFDINLLSVVVSMKISKKLSTIFKAVSEKLAEGSKRLVDYANLWINQYISPILKFIKDIFSVVSDILTLVPSIGINVSYSVYNDYGDDDDGGDNGDSNGGGGWGTSSKTRSLGMT